MSLSQIVSLKIKFAIEKLLIINFISHLLSFTFFHLIFSHTTYFFDAVLLATHLFSFAHDFHFFRSFASISISQMSSFSSCSLSMMYCATIAFIFILYSFFVAHLIIHILTQILLLICTHRSRDNLIVFISLSNQSRSKRSSLICNNCFRLFFDLFFVNFRFF